MQCKYYQILLGGICEWSLWRVGRFIEVVFQTGSTVYSESLFNTLYIKQMLKKFPSDKINGTKNVFFFFFRELQLTTVFLLLIRDSYMSWSSKFISLKACVGFSTFDFVSFLLKLIFLFNKNTTKFFCSTKTFKSYNPFQN